ncbi:energy-coupling factor transporter transmembrane component T family protein [Canibacter zhoujuaniae]|uniref:energy-coupling factor transporter transmembrane component T family protein n=1 Tax=Canibacter zhoujuaniae TaxID=2708343 RepID=UPI0014232C0D|nr:energy-coupling factor transporter transmembrane protein EcfT [Canibacter zhoujuaniae]
MAKRGYFLGRYWPNSGWLHNTPAGVKVSALILFSAIAAFVRSPQVIWALICFTLILGLSAKLPLRELVRPLQQIWLLILVFGVIQLLLASVASFFSVIGVMILCVLNATVLILTTRVSELLELFRTCCTPLRLFGIDPERPALAAAIAISALPVLLGLVEDARIAATARGLQRSIRARTLPVILGAVKHAEDTAKALQARNLV